MDDTAKSFQIEPTFRMLEACLIRLDSIAPVPESEQIRSLMDDVPKDSRQLILVELIKCDMAVAADLGVPRSIEFYLPAFADWLPREQVPMDLILEEIQLRRDAGEEPDWKDYLARFPGLPPTMGRLLARGESTSRCAQRTPLPELAINETVDDFLILGLLGQGAFARVYLARQESMQRLVALKASLRGSDEPQSLSQLDHPNVVRVYDQRVCISPALRLLYMQYVPGGTLADCIELARNKPMAEWSGRLIVESVDRSLTNAGQFSPEGSPTRELIVRHDWATAVTWLGVQLAEGLHYAHSRNVLHRDIKPANILLSSDGVPKLADFNVSFSGLAGRAGAAANFGGSLAYMSPEQLRAADPTDAASAGEMDNRSDLFSLGVVLWELFQGERPWKMIGSLTNWSAAIQAQLAARQAPLPTAPTPNAVGRVLDQVLRRALSFSRDERPQSGAEFAGALRLALYPEVAERFHPSPESFAHRIVKIPVLLLIVAVVLIPNIAAAVFNYIYNGGQIVAGYPQLWNKFVNLSLVVNAVLFPIGTALIMWKLWPIAKALREVQLKQEPNEARINAAWTIGHHTAWISGSLWVLAGVIFPVALLFLEPNYRAVDATHFFLSLALCGGVAITYPFFGISLMCVLYYYPQLIRKVMSDSSFEQRRQLLLRRSRFYLALAAAVPLLALALLVLREQAPRLVLLATIGTTALGLLASFFAYQKIEETLRQMAAVLAPKHSLARTASE